MALSLSPEIQKLIEDRMQHNGFRSADDLVRAALDFFDRAEHLDEQDVAAIEEFEHQIDTGQDLDWKTVSANLRKTYLGS